MSVDSTLDSPALELISKLSGFQLTNSWDPYSVASSWLLVEWQAGRASADALWKDGGGAMVLNQLGGRNSELFQFPESTWICCQHMLLSTSPPSFCERQKFSPSNIRVQGICLGFFSFRESGKWKEQLLRWEELEGSNKNRWWLNRHLFLYSHNTSDTKCVGLFYTKEFFNSLWTRSGVWPFNWHYLSGIRGLHMVKGSLPQDCSYWSCQLQVLCSHLC